MELYLDSILRSGASVVDLLTAKHTFVNERLARHYGLPDVRGDQFRRVELDDPHRFGLFGKGSVLMVTSYPDRTSPVLRGAWIMEQILAAPPNPPPPGVETDLRRPPATSRNRCASGSRCIARSRRATSATASSIRSARRSRTSTPIGEWRDARARQRRAVDSTRHDWPTGQPVNSPEELRAALASDPTLFVHALTEKLLTFALGRGVEYYDMPVVRRIVADAARPRAIVSRRSSSASRRASPFRMRELRAEEPRRRTEMFITKKHLSRRTLLKGGTRRDRLAAAVGDGAGRDGARADGRGARSRAWASSTCRTARS